MNSLFASRLKELRKESGKTQDDVGLVLEVGRSTVGEYERGKIRPTAEKLFKLADYFSVSVDYLVGNTNKREQANDHDLDVSETLARSIEFVRDKANQIVFQGEPVSNQERKVIIVALENVYRAIKAMRERD